MEYMTVRRGDYQEIGLQDDPLLWSLDRENQQMGLFGAKEPRWDAPFDLRVMRPSGIDLTKVWALRKQPVPEAIQAALGPRIPVLLNHVVTPFACDGVSPGRVWGLGYEFSLMDGTDANTISVLPTDEVLKIATVGETVEVGLQIGGGVGVPKQALGVLADVPGIALTGAQLDASTDHSFQFSVRMEISLRKVIGAPVGAGGALWKMYRQDERLDKPHTLLQTLLVAPGTARLKCKVKTWAKQAGWLGTRWGARFWPYEDQVFEVSLAGLPDVKKT